MSEQKERTIEMAALKMPHEQMGFIRNNQKIAQKVGKIMVMLTDMQKSVSTFKELLGKPELFKQYLENGTEEELASFLQVCLKLQETPDAVFHVRNIPEEAFDKVVSKLGDHVVATKTEVTEPVKLFKRNHEQTEENS